ncbi:MAG TPA: glycine cleavage system protein GcvH [Geobacteraceae bacterium]|jgi:glycine cleavage system H protein|nr:glycine cleavage system protein GcvH [Geobacteraceae bacterium]
MEFPEELKYSKEHLWVRVEGKRAVIGLTDYAQHELGAISALELPEEGEDLEQDDSFGSVEARKTVAELYAPISGTVLEVNADLVDSPVAVNDDPYDDGWLVVVEVASPEELTSLMSADDYQEYVADEE